MKINDRISSPLLSLAGEHRVASELCKRGVFATITPGKRKQTDLYVINDASKQFTRVEVKASQTKSFLTGIGQKKLPEARPPDFWVLVLFMQGRERFFVLKNTEIEKLQRELNVEWAEGYHKRNPGKTWDPRKGVDTIPLAILEDAFCENRWDKIMAEVGGAEA